MASIIIKSQLDHLTLTSEKGLYLRLLAWNAHAVSSASCPDHMSSLMPRPLNHVQSHARAQTPEVVKARAQTPNVVQTHAQTPEVVKARAQTPEVVQTHAQTPEVVKAHAQTTESNYCHLLQAWFDLPILPYYLAVHFNP